MFTDIYVSSFFWLAKAMTDEIQLLSFVRLPRRSRQVIESFLVACLVGVVLGFSDRPVHAGEPVEFAEGQRVALVGGSLAERMNLFGHFETILHQEMASKKIVFRNFGWPADEVGRQQRPGNYTAIDDPLKVFAPDLFLCFFGFNESFAGSGAEQVEEFAAKYRQWIETQQRDFSRENRTPRFVLLSPIAFEASGNPLQPDGQEENHRLRLYSATIERLAEELGFPYVNLFEPSSQAFASEPGLQYTINGIHLSEQGDRWLAEVLAERLLGIEKQIDFHSPRFERLRAAVNDKSWVHLQDYRMLNGWYVYGGRRTWDTETFPREYVKIRKMAAVRDQYIWDLAVGNPVSDQPDDSETGEVFIPETMFGTRDEGFRRGREPEDLNYPTPEESISQMRLPEGYEVRLFASEREFPELANPTQIDFDNQGRLWVSCMVSYPQWLPGTAKPSDRLLILEDTDNDGLADKCTTFYDKLACPTGFEFWNGGVLVVDEPRILFLKDTDGDNVADEVTHLLDGIGTDDTHHAMGAWEFSHGGLLHMLEGIAMSTTLETPYGPFRVAGPSGSYVWDPLTLKFRYFRTPAYGNPWCLVFDPWGNGIIGDGTGATHHWTTPLAGADVPSRKTLRPIFDNQGMRPAVGNDFLRTRQFPEEVHDHFVYGCVINMHGLPRFVIDDEPEGAGLTGKRIEDFLSSSDMFFRPVDPKIGPDGTLWFGDWCNALIGHMQYSQRDPNRDHEHGRIYRLVYRDRPLLEPVTQADKTIDELIDQLTAYESRTRYRARRELRDREKQSVLEAIERWSQGAQEPMQLCEALWIQESFRQLSPTLLDRLMASDEYRARAAAVHAMSNEWERVSDIESRLEKAIRDPHPRVRTEALRGLSFLGSLRAAEIALLVTMQPMDYWIEYTLEHTMQALEPAWKSADEAGTFLATSSEEMKRAFLEYKYSTGPGKAIYKPLRTVTNVDLPLDQRRGALNELASARGGNIERGREVFSRVCAACHQVEQLGKAFGPNLTDLAKRMPRHEIVESIVWPNEKIAKGYETITVVTDDGRTINGFVLKEDEDLLILGIANGKVEEIDKGAIEIRREMKASSMPEGLTDTIAPIEFLDLLQFLAGDWIATANPDQGALRTHGEFVEISRDGQVRIGDDYPPQWNGDVAKLLSGVNPGSRDFAFHSSETNPEPPAIVIRLPEVRELRHVWMQNRVNRQFQDRAKDLTVWISEDGQTWTQVWDSPQAKAEYHVDLPAGTRASHVKIGIPHRATLHLNQVVLYGVMPD